MFTGFFIGLPMKGTKGNISHEQMIVKGIKFLSVFYDLVPHGREITRRHVDAACDFTPRMSRYWLNSASRVLPLVNERYPGTEMNDGQKVPFMHTWRTL